ncbi:hypothetical protein ANCCAN_18985 [Ancylostoma caninum]|uniref:Nuclear transcription factor Y subunit n=1 Tax=Ancylostoma caninum TaxID=29170 RepID=A0A368FSW2_ANCCA|nr:hypothetical protein ANCCAN_18985 [Ancylostoma caninum]
MHFTFFLVGFLVFIIQRSSSSFPQGDSNGGSELGGQGAPMFMHMHTPVMYSAPLMAAAPLSLGGQYGMNSQNSGAGNSMGSYGRGQGRHILIELPFRRARARKVAANRGARMHKNLKRNRKANKH